MRHRISVLRALTALCLLIGLPTVPFASSAHAVEASLTRSGRVTPADRRGSPADLLHLPLRFEENRGQADDQVAFVMRSGDASLFLTSAERVLVLSSHADATVEGASA